MLIDFLFFYLLILCLMIVFFLVAWAIKDNSIVDIAWGLGVVMVAAASLIRFPDFYYRKALISILASIWGLRLAIYILVRKKGHGEDSRYKTFREKWGNQVVIKSLFYIFLFQGTLQLLIVLPILFINRSSPSGWSFFDFFGLGFFVIGFIFETLADRQMYRFKKDPANKGKLITTGIWKYSRHPNYFGETTLWWGMGIMALSVEGGWIALIGPLLVTYLLLFFSGIPLLEKKYQDRPDFQRYKAQTSAFFPWFKRRNL